MSQKQPNIDRKRTRVDPFADVYDSDIVPMLELDTQGAALREDDHGGPD